MTPAGCPPGRRRSSTTGRGGLRPLWAAAAVAAAWGTAFALNRASRQVTGTSMVPTLHPGDVVVVVPVRGRRLRRGDLVVVRDPREPSRETVKRVAAIAGEVADLPGGVGRVPPRHVAVRGDAAASTDSRTFGAVPYALVVGRAFPLPRHGRRRR